jgi:hypothetical protein
MSNGTQFLDWLERTALGGNWSVYVTQIPLGRVYEIVDEARRRSLEWRSFAEALENRVQGVGSDRPAWVPRIAE